MRKSIVLAVLAVLPFPAASWAAPASPVCELPKLPAAPKAMDPAPDPQSVPPVSAGCFRDEVLVLPSDGLIKCGTKMDMATMMPVEDKANCWLHTHLAAAKVAEFLQANNLQVPDTQWDQIVMFASEMLMSSAETAAMPVVAAGPLFYREGYKEDATGKPVTTGVNEVDGIGLVKGARVAGRPWVGYIAAGGTQQVPANAVLAAFNAVCGAPGRTAQIAPAPQRTKALCYPGLYSYFDALAQATGAQFGPYLKLNAMKSLGVLPVSKGAVVVREMMMMTDAMGMMTTTTVTKSADDALMPRIWNSFLNMRGSLFAGNTFRDNGNGTFDMTLPSAHRGINPPVPVLSAAGQPGRQGLRFMPLDLYVMGFADAESVTQSFPIQSFMDAKADHVYRPVGGAGINETMGQRQGGVTIRLAPKNIPMADLVMANGARAPGFAEARHNIRQLWVLFAKPQDLIDATAKAGDALDLFTKRLAAHTHASNVTLWRKQYGPYFYMLTTYRGRVITTFEGNVDDNPYWEFGQAVDDKRLFTGEGLELAINGDETVVNSPDIKNVIRILNTPGGTGAIRFSPNPADPNLLPTKIVGSQAQADLANNAVTVRMKIAPNPMFAKNSYAVLQIDGGPEFRLPATCGNPPKAGCTEEGVLVADGKWHNYTASLADDPAFTGGTFSGFRLVPSAAAYAALEGSDGIEIEFIRFGKVASTKDADMTSSRCNACQTSPNATMCMTQCQRRDPGTIVNIPRADGWIDSEDNCPKVYNPDQADGNEDGIGDACEDFDGDAIINSWDNCPTTTNSGQRDRDADGLGDICDGGAQTTEGCFLQPDSLGGKMKGAPSIVTMVLLGGVVGLLAFRRRRRR